MNFSLLLSHLPQTQQPLHPDVHGARLRAEAASPRCQPTLAARWRDLRTRVFRI